MNGIVFKDGNESLLMIALVLLAVAVIMYLLMRKRPGRSMQ
jgi:ABC-type branched-subunit amino acid transport system permease subunit